MDPRNLYVALNNKAGFEKVGDNVTEHQLRVIGRVPKARMPTWLATLRTLLQYQRSAPWNVDVSRQYFLQESENDRLRFGWRLIFQAENVLEFLPHIIKTIETVQVVRREVEEVPIQRSSHRASMTATGKGASNIKGDAGVPPIVAAKMGIR